MIILPSIKIAHGDIIATFNATSLRTRADPVGMIDLGLPVICLLIIQRLSLSAKKSKFKSSHDHIILNFINSPQTIQISIESALHAQ
jgi:hypothetical protein